MYCKKCGKEIDKEDNFCKYCGEKINEEDTVSTYTVSYEIRVHDSYEFAHYHHNEKNRNFSFIENWTINAKNKTDAISLVKDKIETYYNNSYAKIPDRTWNYTIISIY